MNVLTFWVDGRPVPKERARTIRTKSGKYRTFTPPRTAAWEQRVRLVAQAACSAVRWRPVPARYEVDVTVYRARRAGDGDNFLKAAKDALNGVVWPDDRMVMRATCILIDGQGQGMRVRVSRELATCGKKFRRLCDGAMVVCTKPVHGADHAHGWDAERSALNESGQVPGEGKGHEHEEHRPQTSGRRPRAERALHGSRRRQGAALRAEPRGGSGLARGGDPPAEQHP